MLKYTLTTSNNWSHINNSIEELFKDNQCNTDLYLYLTNSETVLITTIHTNTWNYVTDLISEKNISTSIAEDLAYEHCYSLAETAIFITNLLNNLAIHIKSNITSVINQNEALALDNLNDRNNLIKALTHQLTEGFK